MKKALIELWSTNNVEDDEDDEDDDSRYNPEDYLDFDGIFEDIISKMTLPTLPEIYDYCKENEDLTNEEIDAFTDWVEVNKANYITLTY